MSIRAVVVASSAGTAFEWYDFFLFVPLAGTISRTFFAGLDETTSYIFALGAFAVGFAFRPLGALIFGRIGDRIGRKATFLTTMALMGLSTFAIGLLPSYAQVGVVAPIAFMALRILQGLALGGEWGGAAAYIVEHVGDARRGVTSSWLASSAAFGLGAALLAVLLARTLTGEAAFNAWGWRLPFVFCLVLLAIAVWIRLRLHESPQFQKLKDSGARSERPLAESFGQWKNLKVVLVALFGVMCAQGAIWYTVFFYLSSFLEKSVRLAPATVNGVVLSIVALSVPLYVFFGWLSDRVGRRPVMIGGMLLFVTVVFPAFHGLMSAGNPALAEASQRSPVVILAADRDCNVQFDPIGKAKPRSDCDRARSALAAAGIPYRRHGPEAGQTIGIRIGGEFIPFDARGGRLGSNPADVAGGATAKIAAALVRHDYPKSADPGRVQPGPMLFWALVLTVSATALYGPQAAALVELFPTRIRYTAMSLPYHIGTGWVGGFLPASVFAIVSATGDVYSGLWYPAAFATLSLIVSAIFLKETKGRSL